jgi:hypothetical protein
MATRLEMLAAQSRGDDRGHRSQLQQGWQSAASRVHGIMSAAVGEDGLALALGVDVAARGAVVPRGGEGRGRHRGWPHVEEGAVEAGIPDGHGEVEAKLRGEGIGASPWRCDVAETIGVLLG